MPEKKRVAVLFGGHSSEYGVSLQSAASVLEEIDRERFVPISIGISRQGDWYLYEGPIQAIREDAWQRGVGCAPVAFSPSRGGPALLSLEDGTPRGIAVDAAFPVLHGKDGEDGTVQGSWACRWWDAACWPPRCAWTRPARTNWCRRKASACRGLFPTIGRIARRMFCRRRMGWGIPCL